MDNDDDFKTPIKIAINCNTENKFCTPDPPERILIASKSTSKVPLKVRSDIFNGNSGVFYTPRNDATRKLFSTNSSVKKYDFERIPHDEYIKQMEELGLPTPSKLNVSNLNAHHNKENPPPNSLKRLNFNQEKSNTTCISECKKNEIDIVITDDMEEKRKTAIKESKIPISTSKGSDADRRLKLQEWKQQRAKNLKNNKEKNRPRFVPSGIVHYSLSNGVVTSTSWTVGNKEKDIKCNATKSNAPTDTHTSETERRSTFTKEEGMDALHKFRSSIAKPSINKEISKSKDKKTKSLSTTALKKQKLSPKIRQSVRNKAYVNNKKSSENKQPVIKKGKIASKIKSAPNIIIQEKAKKPSNNAQRKSYADVKSKVNTWLQPVKKKNMKLENEKKAIITGNSSSLNPVDISLIEAISPKKQMPLANIEENPTDFNDFVRNMDINDDVEMLREEEVDGGSEKRVKFLRKIDQDINNISDTLFSRLSFDQSKSNNEKHSADAQTSPCINEVDEEYKNDCLKALVDWGKDFNDEEIDLEKAISNLQDIEKQYENVIKSMAQFYISKASIEQKKGDFLATVGVFEDAFRLKANPSEMLVEAISQFIRTLQKNSKFHDLPEADLHTELIHDKAKTIKRTDVDQSKVFLSSVRKYLIKDFNTPYFSRLKKSIIKKDISSIITPVRRSTRKSIKNLPAMLRDDDQQLLTNKFDAPLNAEYVDRYALFEYDDEDSSEYEV